MKNVTIADVAKAAGVSVTTVSRFINGNYKKMSDTTKRRVQQTITELHYAPKASARKMRQDFSQMIGVVVGDISNVFSSLLFKGIYDVLQPAGYDVLLMNSNNSLAAEQNELTRLFTQQVDGLILQPNAETFTPYQRIRDAQLPLVLVDRETVDQPQGVTAIVSSNFDASYQLAIRLANQGYQNIITVSRTLAEISAQSKRIAGFTAGAIQSQQTMVNLETAHHHRDWLQQQLQAKLATATGKTAVISLMGPVLFDLLAVCQSLHLTFPNDIGLVSFDDWTWSQYVNDGIFLLQQQPELMGHVAAEKLLQQIQKAPASATTYIPVRTIGKPSL
ncbi:LacI family DNA-binding transcriptional regulator [Levilactobacillus suantsaiihabitans]|uniref:LacI family DNA-binding transcriptional regulator n=1 Tax=Levilactobacillus suantsaiihabitans TaxID=2487722 RepID=A0A4Z0JCZ3_9LACO|nr:LacI family DNA-binding transcriptional regulator [Levilactobacillus suantsaiihabitans]TGD20067.1 LacI family DNA-binding transcriptional regulator [Levilactobacillus suantsaiihabitans]